MNQLEAFLLTLALEAPIAALIVASIKRNTGRGAAPPPRNVARAHAVRGALCAIVGSAITHPFVWLANERWARLSRDWDWAWKIALIELGAVAVELIVYARLARLPLGRAALTSLVVNAFSFGVGLLIWFALLRSR